MITLAVLFSGSVFLLNRSKPLNAGKLTLLILTAYFLATEQFVEDYCSISFSNPLWKISAYCLLILVPAFLIVFFRLPPKRWFQPLVLSFFLFLPFTRPTVWFLQTPPGKLWPTRYAEDISRIRPPQKWIPQQTEYRSVSEGVSKDDFQRAGTSDRIRMLASAAASKNQLLLEPAIAALERGNPELEFACVQYLRAISGVWIGNDRFRWSEWLRSRVNQITISQASPPAANNPLIQRGFSAVAVQNCVYTAGDRKIDFLTFYLPFFPKQIRDTDLVLLEESIRNFRSGPVPVQNSYRSGMLYFFLALAETKWRTQGNTIDPQKISGHWYESYQHFQQALQIGKPMTVEISKIIQQADQNHDGILSDPEIHSILSTRTK